MPSEVCPGLAITYTPVREDARDVLVLKQPISSLDELPYGATIGTGSKRRKYQLLAVRPDLNIVPIRGNIDTRIGKIETENLDGVVLAAAGIKRIGREEEIGYYIPVETVLPAPAQGALAIEIRENDERIYDLIRPIEDRMSQIQIEAERAFLDGVEGSCHLPIGAYAEIEGNEMTLTTLLGDEEGVKMVKEQMTKVCTTIEEARSLGYEAAKIVLEKLQA